jgi:radical SAM protein (TIGR01212 family)
MVLSDYVNTFGQTMLRHYGERVHKLTLNATFTCPNLDGSKGRGGCTFCNNVSFNPNGRNPPSIREQLDAGRQVIRKRTGARKYIAYFQAYTNTYADVDRLAELYDQALVDPDVIGLSVGTRPDCVPDEVLDLLAGYQDKGKEVWLELGLQSAWDDTLQRVNRGHGFEAYRLAVHRAHARGLKVCTHLIIGLPGEDHSHCLTTLQRVLELGVEGLKLHPLHVVKGTMLANQWRRGEYQPLALDSYISTACDMIELTPADIVYHRVTGTASPNILLAPAWCAKKWDVLNGISQELERRHTWQNAVNGTTATPLYERSGT